MHHSIHRIIGATGAAALRTGAALLVCAAVFSVFCQIGSSVAVAFIIDLGNSFRASHNKDGVSLWVMGVPVLFGLLQLGSAVVIAVLVELGAHRLNAGERSVWPVAASLLLFVQPVFAFTISLPTVQLYGVVAGLWIAPIVMGCALVGLFSYVALTGQDAEFPHGDRTANQLQLVFTAWSIAWVAVALWLVQSAWVLTITAGVGAAPPALVAASVMAAIAVSIAAALGVVLALSLFVVRDALLDAPSWPAPLMLLGVLGTVTGAFAAAACTLQFVGSATWLAVLLMASGTLVLAVVRFTLRLVAEPRRRTAGTTLG